MEENRAHGISQRHWVARSAVTIRPSRTIQEKATCGVTCKDQADRFVLIYLSVSKKESGCTRLTHLHAACSRWGFRAGLAQFKGKTRLVGTTDSELAFNFGL